MPDINVNELAEAINDKMDTDLSNTSSNPDVNAFLDALLSKGVDVVIESQLPTAENNYTWYRKYKSGWVEQGGHIMATTSAWASTTITLPVTMANRYYCISRAGNWSDAASSSCTITAMTTTTFTITYAFNTMDYGGTMWEVKGMAAQ